MIDERAAVALFILAAVLLIIACDALFNGRERSRPAPASDWRESDFGDLPRIPVHERISTDA